MLRVLRAHCAFCSSPSLAIWLSLVAVGVRAEVKHGGGRASAPSGMVLEAGSMRPSIVLPCRSQDPAACTQNSDHQHTNSGHCCPVLVSLPDPTPSPSFPDTTRRPVDILALARLQPGLNTSLACAADGSRPPPIRRSCLDDCAGDFPVELQNRRRAGSQPLTQRGVWQRNITAIRENRTCLKSVSALGPLDCQIRAPKTKLTRAGDHR